MLSEPLLYIEIIQAKPDTRLIVIIYNKAVP